MEEEKLITLQEATKFCPYSQEYLSLRARQGKIRAVKIGKVWKIKKEWIEDYLRELNDAERRKLNDENSVLSFADFQALPGVNTIQHESNLPTKKNKRSDISFLIFILFAVITIGATILWTQSNNLSDIGYLAQRNLSMFYKVINLNASLDTNIIKEYFSWLSSLWKL